MGTIQKYISTKNKKPTTTFRAKVRMKGVSLNQSFRTATQAQEWIDREERQIKRDFRDGTLNRAETSNRTMREAVVLYRIERLHELTGIKTWGSLLNFVEKYLGDFKLSELRKKHILKAREQYRNHRNPSLENSTCNRFTTAVSMVLTMARTDWEWMNHDPMDGLKRYNENSLQRTRWLRDEERVSLMEVAAEAQNPCLPAVIDVAIMTGYRKDTIKNLLWENIDFEAKVIRLPPDMNPQGKRGKPRPPNIQIVSELFLVLVEHRKFMSSINVESPYVFPSPDDVRKPWDFKQAFINAVKTAKISDFTFHDLRHTTGTYLARKKVPTHIIQRILGHSNPKTTMKYVQHPDEIIISEMERAFKLNKASDPEKEVA